MQKLISRNPSITVSINLFCIRYFFNYTADDSQSRLLYRDSYLTSLYVTQIYSKDFTGKNSYTELLFMPHQRNTIISQGLHWQNLFIELLSMSPSSQKYIPEGFAGKNSYRAFFLALNVPQLYAKVFAIKNLFIELLLCPFNSPKSIPKFFAGKNSYIKLLSIPQRITIIY